MTVILTGSNLKYQSKQSNIFCFCSFQTRRPLIDLPTIFTSDWIWWYKKMFSNWFCVLPQQNVPYICECVGTHVHYGDILNPSLSSVCCSAAGTLGAAHLSFQSGLPGTATVSLIGSHHQPLPGGRTWLIGSEQIWRRPELKDKEVRARALILLMSRGCARPLRRFATCTHVPRNTWTEAVLK